MDKYRELLKAIGDKVAVAETKVEAGEDVSALMDEIKAMRAKAEQLKAVVASRVAVVAEEKELELTAAKAEIARLKAEGEQPVRLPFSGEQEENPVEMDTQKATYALRFGETDGAVEAVIRDLYGPGYNDKRVKARDAFVKYLRYDWHRLNAEEFGLLKPGSSMLLLPPETIKEAIKSGKSVQEIKATLQEGTLDVGGALVPEDYRQDIIRRLMGLTFVRQRARRISTSRDSVEWPKLDGGNSQYTSGVRVTWVNEVPGSATVAQTNPTFAMEQIPVHTVMARTDLSRNLLEDSAVDLLGLVAQLFSEAMAIDEDDRFLTGTGGGAPQGVLGSRSGAEKTPVPGVTSVVSGSAAALTAEGLIDLVYQLDTQYTRNAVLVAAKSTHKAVRKLKDGTSNFIWERSLVAGQPPALLGYPIYEDESMPTVSANAYPVIFGDFSGYLIVDRIGMQIERVADATTVGTNTVALFARRRLGGQVVEPWKFVVQKCST